MENENPINYIRLFWAVFGGIFLAIFLNLLAVKAYLTYEANMAIAAMEEMTKKQAVESKKRQAERQSQLEAQRRETERRQRQAKIEAERQRSIARTQNEVCSFWRQEYASNSSEYNRLMKEKACQK
ncbi:hypothetical protein [Thiohalophilus thiocyanatoxydans]|uniref:Uncharacterized protein n=1 Tax=Thiohalophilus thiocyanatoxydans TaxID=381308 RepID=A0A4R8IPK3_9GAMM|nr:hypothetical protein [Thiohalophilus thiocyanatoxydans]TDY02861.1 hypothetical protein EDC23_1245 [Thiohalophilus thiocyanatoxydans]